MTGISVACGAGTYSASQAGSCTACPANSTSAANAATCVCNAGYVTTGFGTTLACTRTVFAPSRP